MKRSILVDSSAGFKPADLKKYPDIFLINMPIIVNHEEILTDYSNFSEAQFYNMLLQNDVSTSQISLSVMREKWRELLKTYDHVLFMGISEHLSSQHRIMLNLANEPEFVNHVTVYNTQNVTVPLRIMVQHAYEWLVAGESMEIIDQKLKKLSSRFLSIFFISDARFLIKSGRISKVLAEFCQRLRITPILQLKNGKITKYGQTRTLERAVSNVLTEMHKTSSNNEIVVLNGNLEQARFELINRLLKKFNWSKIDYMHTSFPIAVHLGPNVFGFLVIQKG